MPPVNVNMDDMSNIVAPILIELRLMVNRYTAAEWYTAGRGDLNFPEAHVCYALSDWKVDIEADMADLD